MGNLSEIQRKPLVPGPMLGCRSSCGMATGGAAQGAAAAGVAGDVDVNCVRMRMRRTLWDPIVWNRWEGSGTGGRVGNP